MGVPLEQVSRHAVVYTDASTKGWGATFNGLAVSGVWTRAVVKSTFVESKTSPSPKRFESESSPSPKRFESESSPSPNRFESKSKSK